MVCSRFSAQFAFQGFKLLMLAAFLAASSNVFSQDPDGPVTLEGQVVCCLDCWLEKDRPAVEFGTADDLLRAKGCVEGGDPTLIAVREGDKFRILVLKEGGFRLPGENWLEFVGARVRVTGKVHKKDKLEHVVVDRFEVIEASLAERQAKAVLGTSVDLKLPDLSGAEQDLSLFRGRVVVLNFWATFCEPCRKEMPDLAEIQDEFAPFGIQVIGANADAAEDRAKVLRFIREVKINFPVWTGAAASDMVRFGLGEALPGTVVIGKDGRVEKVISGVVDPAKLRREIERLLGLTAEVLEPPAESEPVAAAKPKKTAVSSVPS